MKTGLFLGAKDIERESCGEEDWTKEGGESGDFPAPLYKRMGLIYASQHLVDGFPNRIRGGVSQNMWEDEGLDTGKSFKKNTLLDLIKEEEEKIAGCFF